MCKTVQLSKIYTKFCLEAIDFLKNGIYEYTGMILAL